MDSRRLKLLLPLLGALIVGAALGYALRGAPEAREVDARALADSALLSVREQGRLIVFSARFASVVTASENRLGLTARKTLIMPATVRYGIDLSRLRRENLAWDEATKTLSVTLPPLEISRPSIDLNHVQ